MINFYPGPSKLYPEIGAYLQEAFESGILEINHRSEAFMQLDADTKQLLKDKLDIPANYEIVFVSSATECWEIISQSFVQSSSCHCYNGAFGEKWYDYAHKIHSSSKSGSFSIGELPNLQSIPAEPELLAFTHNETSNGSALPLHFQKSAREKFPSALIAYDVTSSMAGYALNWLLGDIWYASVQKCFGLPPGMAIMVLSPQAVKRAGLLGDDKFYNSFNYILRNAANNQTHHTPNTSNIFLLNRTLKKREDTHAIHKNLIERKQHFFNELSKFPALSNYETTPDLQSDTVFCLSADSKIVGKLKSAARKKNIILGSGYGELKNSTFRIANFPAILPADFDQLALFLSDFFKED
jgi:phosphoserine aminotransferase